MCLHEFKSLSYLVYEFVIMEYLHYKEYFLQGFNILNHSRVKQLGLWEYFFQFIMGQLACDDGIPQNMNFFLQKFKLINLSIRIFQNLQFIWTLTMRIFTWPRLNSLGFWEHSYQNPIQYCLNLGHENIHMWPGSKWFWGHSYQKPMLSCSKVGHENVHMAWVKYPRLLGPFLPKSHVILLRPWPREYTFR